MLFEYTDILELTAENQLSAAARQEIDALDQKLLNHPQDLESLLQKGFVLFQSHLDGQAISTFEQVLKLDVTCTEAYIWLAELLLFHWSDTENAKLVLNKLLEFNSESAEGVYLLACAYQKEDDQVEYERLLRFAIQIDPTLIMPRFCLVSLLLEQDQKKLAKVELAQLELRIKSGQIIHGSREEYWQKMIAGRVLTPYIQNKLKYFKSEIETVS